MPIDVNTDNSGVPHSNPDLPQTLADAEQKFKLFLRSTNYPDTICWLTPGDLVIDKSRQYWAGKRGIKQRESATLLCELGTKRNLGISLEAVCATERETFARVFIPEDDIDAEYHLMGSVLKLSCPVRKYRTSAVDNSLHWLLLRLLYRNRSKALEVNQKTLAIDCS